MDGEDTEEHSPLEQLCFSQGELAVLKPLHTDAGEGAGMKKLKGGLSWGEIRAACCRREDSQETGLWAAKSGIIQDLPGLEAT